MLDPLIQVLASTHWNNPQESLDQLTTETRLPKARDFEAILPLARTKFADLSGTIDSVLVYEIGLSGYPTFNEYFDDQLGDVFGEHAGAVSRHRKRLATMVARPYPLKDVFAELEEFHRVADSAGKPITCRMILHKSRLREIHSSPQVTPYIWFSSSRFERWFDETDFHALAQLFSSPIPPTFYVNPDSEGYQRDHLVRRLDELTERDEDLVSFRSSYAEAICTKKREVSGESNAPVVHPLAFIGVAPSWWNSMRFRQLTAYSILCLFSSDIVYDGKYYEFWHASQNRTSGTRVAFRADSGLVTAHERIVPLEPAQLTEALRVCQLYLDSIAESSALKDVWSLVLDSLDEPGLTRILDDPNGVARAYRELKDVLLKSNIANLLTTHEKAQSAIIQVVSQITNDVDTLGGDVERAIVAGVGSGVLSLLGTLLETPSLEIAAPLAGALLAVLFFPNVFGRIFFVEQSLSQRVEDIRAYLHTLTAFTKETIDVDPYLSRFHRHLALAQSQVTAARSRMAAVFALVHALTLTTVVRAMLSTPNSLTTEIAVLITVFYAAYVVFRETSVPIGLRWYLALTSVALAAAQGSLLYLS